MMRGNVNTLSVGQVRNIVNKNWTCETGASFIWITAINGFNIEIIQE